MNGSITYGPMGRLISGLAIVSAASAIATPQSKALPSGGAAKRPVPPPAPAIKLPNVNVLPIVQEAQQNGPTYNPTARYDTQLNPAEEAAFQQWKKQYAPSDTGEDYDLRGAFKSGLTPDAKTGHWPDTFKKPNHPTFSVESQYATGDNQRLAGHWEGDKFVPSTGVAPASGMLRLLPEKYAWIGLVVTAAGLLVAGFSERIQGGASNKEVRIAAQQSDNKNELEAMNK